MLYISIKFILNILYNVYNLVVMNHLNEEIRGEDLQETMMRVKAKCLLLIEIVLPLSKASDFAILFIFQIRVINPILN